MEPPPPYTTGVKSRVQKNVQAKKNKQTQAHTHTPKVEGKIDEERKLGARKKFTIFGKQWGVDRRAFFFSLRRRGEAGGRWPGGCKKNALIDGGKAVLPRRMANYTSKTTFKTAVAEFR